MEQSKMDNLEQKILLWGIGIFCNGGMAIFLTWWLAMQTQWDKFRTGEWIFVGMLAVLALIGYISLIGSAIVLRKMNKDEKRNTTV